MNATLTYTYDCGYGKQDSWSEDVEWPGDQAYAESLIDTHEDHFQRVEVRVEGTVVFSEQFDPEEIERDMRGAAADFWFEFAGDR